jgi:CPA2 family monovalent cation:H+ antiporter-2
VVGYILAGVIIGPHTPPFSFISNDASIRTLADLGVIFLMFSLGLQFNLRRLRKVGATAVVTALLDVLVMLWLGFLLGRHWGWGPVESLFLGAIICDSSTTILVKMLSDAGRLRERCAGVLAGITVVEDVLAVVLMAVLTGLAVSGHVETGLVGTRIAELALFLVMVTVVGILALPRLIDRVARTQSDELLVVTVLGCCFGVSLLAAKMQLSVALGAVLVGAIASESQAADRLERGVRPLRHVFGAVFFVAVGLLFDPSTALRHWPAVLGVTALVIAGKFANCAVGTLLTGNDLPTALRVGAGMAQIGEFAFIIAALGLTLGAIEPATYQIAVATSVCTTLLSPYSLRLADRLMPAIMQRAAGWRWHATLDLYSQWLHSTPSRRQMTAVRRVVRRSLWVIAANVAVIAAFFATASLVAQRHLLPIPTLFNWRDEYRTVMWLTAMLLSLPLYIATILKVRALAMVMAEISVPVTVSTPWAPKVRAVLTHTVTLAGVAGLVLLTLMLSSALLPSPRTLVPLILLVVILGVWSQRILIRLYSRAQASLENVLTGDDAAPAEDRDEDARAFAGKLGEARLHSTVLPPQAAAVGRRLRDLDIRRLSGASVMGVERSGQTMTSPDADFVFQAQDRVYLLGRAEQLAAARQLLNGAG